MIQPEVAVAVHGLTRHFGAVRAVDDISFDVRAGELFGLVGPDGAGKTTTLRILAGVLPPTSGDAQILGTSVLRHPEKAKHKIAYMSQRFGLYTDLTVLENLHFYADLHLVPQSEREVRVERLFRFSNLEPFRDRLAGQLSGGMKQKLGLSCALIHQPDLLLLDEPTLGVDPVSRRDLWLIVHEMVAQGVTVVVSTAYMDEAERFDRLAFLHRGRILATDSPEALRAGVTGELIAVRVDRPRDAREFLRGTPYVRDAVIFGERLHVTVDRADQAIPRLDRTLSQAGFAVQDVRPVVPTLEDVFIAEVRDAESS